MKRTFALVAGTAVALAGVAVPGSASAAATYKACVNKKTGEARMLMGKAKKCSKGWKKVTWSKAGPQGRPGSVGPQGAPGAASFLGVVVDASGAVVGRSMGMFSPTPAFTYMSVKIDDGFYSYLANGWLLPQGSPAFLEPTCTGAAFEPVDDVEQLQQLTSATGWRLVNRTAVGSSLGPARAFKLAGTTSTLVSTKLYELDNAGVCIVAYPSFTGYRVDLTEIPAPQDRPGPLRVL